MGMSLYQRYQLIEPLPGDGIWSFRARDAATGKPVTVHLLVGAFTPYYDRLLQTLRGLPPSASSAVVEIGNDRGTPFVVIAAPPFQNLVTWLQERTGLPQGDFSQFFGQASTLPPAGSDTGAFRSPPAGPGEFTRMFGRQPPASPSTPPDQQEAGNPTPGTSLPSEYTTLLSRPENTAAIPEPHQPSAAQPQMQAPYVPPPEPAPPRPPGRRLPKVLDRVRRRRVQTAPESRTVDRVHITVTAPATLVPGRAHELRIWAHLQEQAPGVLERALAAFGTLDPRRIFRKTEGPFEIPRDTSLHIVLYAEDIVVTDPQKVIRWTGDIGCAGFVLKVPADCPPGPKPATASIRVQDTELARIDFVLQVGRGRTRTEPLPAKLTRHRAAFASYASEDRDAVLARIQGIQKAAPYMKIFVDVLDLRSGEDWEKTLLEIIPRVDVFYLFWCRHARQSEWVDREWRCAYRAKGLDFIDPVPLEPAAAAPPPPELARKHFGEPILALLHDHAHGA
jgi:hypothetical protein